QRRAARGQGAGEGLADAAGGAGDEGGGGVGRRGCHVRAVPRGWWGVVSKHEPGHCTIPAGARPTRDGEEVARGRRCCRLGRRQRFAGWQGGGYAARPRGEESPRCVRDWSLETGRRTATEAPPTSCWTRSPP